MKWYFAANEKASRGDGALHAKIAVLSALKNTKLKPHMLTTGFENEFVDWMRSHGVRVIPTKLSFENAIVQSTNLGKYTMDFLGHWLRSEVCNVEKEDEYVLYTDYDVSFFSEPTFENLRPEVFACAPEFKQDQWNYFNSGVMLMNVQALRSSYKDFAEYVSDKILNSGGHFLDQNAYNIFYRERWSKMGPEYNWKPYWPGNKDAKILHFHGPKLGLVQSIMDGRVPFDSPHMITMGSLVASFPRDYAFAIRQILASIEGRDLQQRPWLERLAERLDREKVPVPDEAIDLRFLDFQVFPSR